ncbi:MAG: apolipoprotein N-acyltransferase [Nitrospina sp.]|nr:apolipoprotein N-acyltransferase [Nitrospina sp.]MBT6717739.1 apolipoprotein N-acyltransferase [Nitrospina sp.]
MVFYNWGLSWINNTLINYGNLHWILSFAVLGLLSAYLSFFVALFCYFVRRTCGDNRICFFLFAPVLWVSFEYLRSTHSEYGFSWLGLGYSQFQNLPVIQAAEWTGVYGISWLIILVNSGLYLSWKCWREQNQKDLELKTGWRILSVTLLVFSLWQVYGTIIWKQTLSSTVSKRHIKIGLVQGNVEQFMKWNPAYQNQVINKYKELTLKAAKENPALIIWPETATPYYFEESQTETEMLRNLAREIKIPILFGSPHRKKINNELVYFNSAYLLSETGETLSRYDKMHLVPFGEFVPFRKILFFIEKLVVMIGDFGRGTEATVMETAGNKVGVSICYELIFPDLIRQAVKNGANFLVNITNDAWFGKSAASYQHMSMGALRAVENRVPIVRAANTGISGTIEATGKLRDETKLFVDDIRLTLIAPATGEKTFYSLNGDVFSWVCLLATGWIAVAGRRKTGK